MFTVKALVAGSLLRTATLMLGARLPDGGRYGNEEVT